MRQNLENAAKNEEPLQAEVRRKSYSMLSEMNDYPRRESLTLMHL
jgi:hypothetical protein